jgi:hypothetical protein
VWIPNWPLSTRDSRIGTSVPQHIQLVPDFKNIESDYESVWSTKLIDFRSFFVCFVRPYREVNLRFLRVEVNGLWERGVNSLFWMHAQWCTPRCISLTITDKIIKSVSACNCSAIFLINYINIYIYYIIHIIIYNKLIKVIFTSWRKLWYSNGRNSSRTLCRPWNLLASLLRKF